MQAIVFRLIKGRLCCFRLMAVLSPQRSMLDFRGQRLLLEIV